MKINAANAVAATTSNRNMPLLTELEGCSGGHVLRESSVRIAMFIADEPQNAVQAPSGAACLRFNA